MKDKFTYDIVYVKELGKYRVFIYLEERMYYRGIFSSPSKKECLEWLKKYKEDRKKKK